MELPVAIATDRDTDARLIELRIYFSTWPLTGRHAIRPPLLQPEPSVREADVVGEYQRALAAGEADAMLATFEADVYVREPAGGPTFTAAVTSFERSSSCSSRAAVASRSSTAP